MSENHSPTAPDGTLFMVLEIPEAVVVSVADATGSGSMGGLRLDVTGFGGSRSFLDPELHLLSEHPLGFLTLTVQVPLESDPAEAAAVRAGFEQASREGLSFRLYLRRNLVVSTRPYDVVSFTHDQGTFEVLASS